jgi:hypothetical protein
LPVRQNLPSVPCSLPARSIARRLGVALRRLPSALWPGQKRHEL